MLRSVLSTPALCTLTALCSVACGTTSTTAAARASSPAATPAGLMLHGTVTTSDNTTLTASFQAPVQIAVNQEPSAAPKGYTCGAYAAGSGGSFLAPVFYITSRDHGLYFDGSMATGYSGPGSYSSDTTPALGGTASIATGVGEGQAPAYSIFRSRIQGSSKLTVNSNGSGTFVFTTWGSDEVRGDTGSAADISGTVTWTCG